jgi:hypothetical protein
MLRIDVDFSSTKRKRTCLSSTTDSMVPVRIPTVWFRVKLLGVSLYWYVASSPSTAANLDISWPVSFSSTHFTEGVYKLGFGQQDDIHSFTRISHFFLLLPHSFPRSTNTRSFKRTAARLSNIINMKTSAIILSFLASIVAGNPIETRQFGNSVGTTANEFTQGGCKPVIFFFARGTTEVGNMVSRKTLYIALAENVPS